MIRINLVPKEIGRQEAVRRQLELFILVIILIVVVIIAIYTSTIARYAAVKKELSKVHKLLEEKQAIVNQVNAVQAQKASLDRRVNVIRELVKGQFNWVEVLDEINICLPPTVWITSISSAKKGAVGNLTFNAYAFDNFAIADFITALEESSYFSKVELSHIQKGPSEAGAAILNFSLSCQATF